MHKPVYELSEVCFLLGVAKHKDERIRCFASAATEILPTRV
jgi:hypothetical protein